MSIIAIADTGTAWQVSRIALAVLGRGIATVNAAVGDDLCGWNDVARGPSGTGFGKTPSLMHY
jgi:hypothetical protein